MTQLLRNLGKADIRNILAVLIVLGSFTMLGVLALRPVPHENKDILNIGIGFVLGGALSGVAGYYFGSSKPQNKDVE